MPVKRALIWKTNLSNLPRRERACACARLFAQKRFGEEEPRARVGCRLSDYVEERDALSLAFHIETPANRSDPGEILCWRRLPPPPPPRCPATPVFLPFRSLGGALTIIDICT
jgi:hypothetical protein